MKKNIGYTYLAGLLILVLAMGGYLVNIQNSYNREIMLVTGEVDLLKSKLSATEMENQRQKKELEGFKSNELSRESLAFSMKEVLNKSLAFKNNAAELGYVPYQLLNGEYTIDEAVENQKRIVELLDSFVKLTDLSINNLTSDEILTIGNLDWEIQHIGFNNILTRDEIALREMQFIIKRLDFELAICLFELGDIDITELQTKKDAFTIERESFELYISKVGFVD